MYKHNLFNFDYPDLISETKETGRTYESPEGNRFPSITTVLSILSEDALKAWRQKVGYEKAMKISRQAAWRGTQTHNALEMHVKNIEPSLDNPLIEFLYKQVAYTLEDRLEEVNGIEQALYSDFLGVAGRVDLVGIFDGKRSIIDFKTSAKPKSRRYIENYFMQEAFYAIAWEERTRQPINQLVTIIANEQTPTPQVFIEKRNDWAKPLMETIEEWKKRHRL